MRTELFGTSRGVGQAILSPEYAISIAYTPPPPPGLRHPGPGQRARTGGQLAFERDWGTRRSRNVNAYRHSLDWSNLTKASRFERSSHVSARRGRPRTNSRPGPAGRSSSNRSKSVPMFLRPELGYAARGTPETSDSVTSRRVSSVSHSITEPLPHFSIQERTSPLSSAGGFTDRPRGTGSPTSVPLLPATLTIVRDDCRPLGLDIRSVNNCNTRNSCDTGAGQSREAISTCPRSEAGRILPPESLRESRRARNTCNRGDARGYRLGGVAEPASRVRRERVRNGLREATIQSTALSCICSRTLRLPPSPSRSSFVRPCRSTRPGESHTGTSSSSSSKSIPPGSF
jgi:hypothetical protein